MEKTIVSIPEQIKAAMDGRTQRWLSMKAMIPEADLSNKMKGKSEFTDEELRTISSLLKVKIKK